jgi:hypothetical protein
MTYSYSKLFTIEILHEYFLNGKCRDLEIIPASDSKSILKQMNVQLRNIENQLFAIIKDNGADGPFINPTTSDKFYHNTYDKTVLRFYLRLNNSLFFHYSNLNFSYNSNQKFYFSNLAANDQNGFLNLSTPVEEYAAGTNYIPGDLVADPDTKNVFEAIKKNSSTKKAKLTDPSVWAPKGLLNSSIIVNDFSAGKTYHAGDLAREPGKSKIYEAIKKYTSNNVKELSDPLLWISRGEGQLQYPTDNDLVNSCGDNYVFIVSAPITIANIAVCGFNFDAGNPAYNVPVLKQETRSFKSSVKQVNINLSGLRPGKYQITVNKETQMIYYDPVLNAGNILGVIEIFNHLTGKDDYSLLDDNEKIKNVKYCIRFPNRRVLWKYIRKDGKAKSISDTGDTGYVFNLDGEEFVSATPIPLSESIVKTLKLDFNSKDFSMHPLPNPSVQRLGKFVQNDYDYFCSEVYLNY